MPAPFRAPAFARTAMSAVTAAEAELRPGVVREARSWPTNLDWTWRLSIALVLTLALTLLIVIQGPDTRDVAVRVAPGAKPVAGTAARASQPGIGEQAASLDASIAAPWPKLQQPTGRFRNILGGGTRYGEATLGYALLQAGAPANDNAQMHAGLKASESAIENSTKRLRPSVIDNLSIASAYNIASR